MEKKVKRGSLKKFKKIPIYVVEEHNDALQFIYSAIGAKKLPVEGTTLVHLDAHPDMLISRNLNGAQARSGKKVLPLLNIENWIVPATAAGFLSRIVWFRPPWAHQLADGTRTIRVGDHPTTGLLRVDSTEPYFLSDALYSADLINQRSFTLSVAELGDPDRLKNNESEDVMKLVEDLEISTPYVLDIDLDFFSTGNPFLTLYDRIGLYDKLEDIFEFKRPISDDVQNVHNVVTQRNKQLHELEEIFQFLEEHDSLEHWPEEKTELFVKVEQLACLVSAEAKRSGISVDWWAVHAAGCTRDQGGLPVHYSTPDQLKNLIHSSLRSLLVALPPPVLITVSRSSEDEYCPPDQVDDIQSLVLQELRDAYNTDEPFLYYFEAAE